MRYRDIRDAERHKALADLSRRSAQLGLDTDRGLDGVPLRWSCTHRALEIFSARCRGDLYRVAWSPHVLEEMRRNLIEDQPCTQSSADALVADMTRAFPEHSGGLPATIADLRNHEEDSHVLAAAVAAPPRPTSSSPKT